jgi:hypothetical protein
VRSGKYPLGSQSRTTALFIWVACIVGLSCRAAQGIGLQPTPTPTHTPSATATSTPRPTATFTPTVTQIPLASGEWRGAADGWDPPLTFAFKVVPVGGAYRVTDLRVFIPEIDMAHFAATLVRTSCTITVEQIEIVDNGFVYPENSPESRRILQARFGSDGRTASGSLFGGWQCEDKPVRFYEVKWQAEAPG